MLCEPCTYISLGSLRRGLSPVKRYAKVAREGVSLSPKKDPGRRQKADERAGRLLEADLEERPAATLYERYALGYSLRWVSLPVGSRRGGPTTSV
jgi:hypothetical protein